MSEPNPYESPKSEEPLQPAQVVKRGVGLATILALTPVAVVSTFCVSCTLVGIMSVPMTTEPPPPSFWPNVSLVLLFGPPLVVLIGMLAWAGVRRVTDARD